MKQSRSSVPLKGPNAWHAVPERRVESCQSMPCYTHDQHHACSTSTSAAQRYIKTCRAGQRHFISTHTPPPRHQEVEEEDATAVMSSVRTLLMISACLVGMGLLSTGQPVDHMEAYCKVVW